MKKERIKQIELEISLKFYTCIKLKNDITLPVDSSSKCEFAQISDEKLKQEILKYITITNNTNDRELVTQVNNSLVKNVLQSAHIIRK